MTGNLGRLPEEAEGKRVRVRLRNGSVHSGWAADGRSGCRWSLTGSPFDIVEYQVL